jgi:hypothetical protein
MFNVEIIQMNKVFKKLIADLEENGLTILNYSKPDPKTDDYLITTNYAILNFNIKTGELVVSFAVTTIAENAAVLSLLFEHLANVKKVEIGRSYFVTKSGVVMGEEAYQAYKNQLVLDVTKEIFMKQQQVNVLSQVECFHC